MTADILDNAQELTQETTDRAINLIRQAAASVDTTNHSGKCLWCGDHTGIDRRFCNKECATDWSKDFDR